MARLHGRSPRGERAHASVPCGTWKRVSVLGAIGSAGMIAALSLDAATDSASFAAYLEQVLLPELQTVKPDAVRKRQPCDAGWRLGLKVQGSNSSIRLMGWPFARRSSTAAM